MSESIQIAVYKLRPQIAVTIRGKLSKIDLDLSYLKGELEKEGYSMQKTKQVPGIKHELNLYYSKWKTSIKWKEFIAEIADDGEEILKHDVSINEGFILFIKMAKGNKIYAITGGFGHTELQGFIDYQFGLDILSRLITTDDKVLKTAKERQFVGGVLGSVKFFRGDYNLNENESFGNYYQELRVKFDKKILKGIFKFQDDEIKKGGICDAKSSFTIKKPITFEKAIEIVETLHSLMAKKPVVDLNLIKKLDKSDKALIEQLEKEVAILLYQTYNGVPLDTNFEICHKVFDKYYDADRFDVTFTAKRKRVTVEMPSCVSFVDIIDEYKRGGVIVRSQDDLETLVENTRIESFDEKGVLVTGASLMDHLCTEIPYIKRSYFLFNQEWYLLKPNFVTTVNKQCQEFINSNQLTKFLRNWKAGSENAFNASHIGDSETLVFDKITPENIEVCDILKWNKDEIFFIHVKKGFNNEMRNLGRQVHIAARRIVEDLGSGKNLLGKLYDELKAIKGKSAYSIAAKKQLDGLSKSAFLDLFNNKKVRFVVAVLDSSKKGKRNFADISKYESNIAKFCLQQLRQEIRNLDIELKIVEIER